MRINPFKIPFIHGTRIVRHTMECDNFAGVAGRVYKLVAFKNDGFPAGLV